MEKQLNVGLPRALLYYRYRVLWGVFFQELGIRTVVSGPTDRETLEQGSALAIDEACLSLKIYLGHVAALLGKCKYILIPRVASFGRHRDMCTRFQALPDLVRNVLRGSSQKFLTCDVDLSAKRDEESAYVELGRALGFSAKDSKRAYRTAKKAELAHHRARVQKQDQLCRQEGLKILIAAHSYVVEDPYVGKTVTDYLKSVGVTPLRADLTDRETALKRSAELSPTCKWEISREILGGILQRRKDIDGIILLSAFPCGPDAMVNELITRRVKGVPMLNLVLDSQTGTAGVETRLESFVDIIRLKGGTL